MGNEVIGSVVLWLIVLAIIIVIAVYLLRWLYRRSTKETAFVRTGFGGEKVVINSGAFVIPVLHEMSPVNMNVMRIEVRRGETTALITRDRMRVDLIAEFFLRVQPTRESVALASQTLGRRAMQPDGIRDLFEGKFASSLRAVAAELTLEEMHEQRSQFMARVRDQAAEALAQNGLVLETVSLVDVDQTSLEFFDPSNAFDAEGLTALTETIETRRKMRNQIEQQTMIEIRNQNLESRAPRPRDRARERICPAGAGARGRDSSRHPALRTGSRAGVARAGSRAGADRLQRGDGEDPDRPGTLHRRNPHRQ